MTQTSLFIEDPTVKHHHGNPESAAAFETVAPHLSRLQGTVLSYIAGRGKGATVKEIRRDLSMEHQTASARLTELGHAELISRVQADGKNLRRDACAVWEITTEGKSRLATWSEKSTASGTA